VVAAYAFNKSRPTLMPSSAPAVVNAYTVAPDRVAGPRAGYSYDLGFTAVEGDSQTGGLTFLQIQSRMGKFEVCGNFPVEVRNRFYETGERWLETAVLRFKDIKLPASFIRIFVQGNVQNQRIELDRTTVKCLHVEAPWQERYYNMNLRDLSFSGPPLPKPPPAPQAPKK
jgi:hypothetical protein